MRKRILVGVLLCLTLGGCGKKDVEVIPFPEQEIIERENLNPEIAIATNEFHEYRAQRIAASIGLESGAVSGKTEIWVVPTYHLRELYGILYEWIV